MSVTEVVDNGPAVNDDGEIHDSTVKKSELLSEPMHYEGEDSLDRIKDEIIEDTTFDTLETTGTLKTLKGDKEDHVVELVVVSINCCLVLRDSFNLVQKNGHAQQNDASNKHEESKDAENLVTTDDELASQDPEGQSTFQETSTSPSPAREDSAVSPNTSPTNRVQATEVASQNEECVGDGHFITGTETSEDKLPETSTIYEAEKPRPDVELSTDANAVPEATSVGRSLPENPADIEVSAPEGPSSVTPVVTPAAQSNPSNAEVADGSDEEPFEEQVAEPSNAEEVKEALSEDPVSGSHVSESTILDTSELRVADGGEVDTPTVDIHAASSTTPDESVNPVPQAPTDAEPEAEPSTAETSTDNELDAQISMDSTEGNASDVDDGRLNSNGEQSEVDGVALQANSVPEAVGSKEPIAEEVRAAQVIALTTESAAVEPSFVASLFPEAKQASSSNTENEHSPEGLPRDLDASEHLDRQPNGDEVVTADIEAPLAPDAEFEQMVTTQSGKGSASFEEDPTASNGGAHIEEQSLVENNPAAEESTVISEKETELTSEGAHEALPDEAIIPKEEMGLEADSTLADFGHFEMAPAHLAIEESSAVPDEDGSPIAPDTQLTENIETTDNAEVPPTLMGSPIRAAQDEPVNPDTDVEASSEVVTGDQLGMELDQKDLPIIGSSQNDLTLADTIEDEPVDSEEPVAQLEEAASVEFADVTAESTHGEMPTDAGEDVQLLARGTSAEEPIESPIVQEEHSTHEQSVNQTPENFEASSGEPDTSPLSSFVVQTVEDQIDSGLSAGETSSSTFSPQSVTNEEQPIQQPVSEQESHVLDENVEISPAVEDTAVKGCRQQHSPGGRSISWGRRDSRSCR
ncbi:hypothetical protein F5890DRAFT_108432 [Lentinula detonsa]|uniref:Uncharacterized protein n=1 Tax=Lentinula detonsa TaxID=2804962 RepID=A0AA38PZC5_9AGAR|nr:hypothetical protein F5890DRAFT_108432 [Lentinula detonsa]